ncbi:uncharacterized protein [Littorina saxatilis]|uniref:uncharacterized protein n=1 Tax=Littorina saxatilis TaxID=31220 RepID=UPI0038B4D842
MGDGGYEDIRFGSNQHAQGPRKDGYAVVDKSKAHKAPASAAIVIASPAHTTEGSDEYAVVDKSSSRNKGNKAANNVSPGLPTSDTKTAGADVYAQVNKSAKTDKAFEPETEGAAYAQVQKPKPAAKPAKPSSKTDVSQRGAADDDEYHALIHTRGSPHTQGQGDSESYYSHI